MVLSEAKQYELAVLLATRFPAWDDRAHIARSAGLGDAQIAGDPLGSWRLILKQAVERDRVPRLLEVCSASDRGDPRLRELAEKAARGELAEPPRRDWAVIVGAIGAVVLGLVLLVVLGMWALRDPAPAVTAAPPVTSPVTVGAPAPAAPEPAPAEAAPAEAPPAAEPAPEAVAAPEAIAPAPAPAPIAAPEPVPAEAPPEEAVRVVAAPAGRVPSGPCKGAIPREGVIGYAYAGAAAPVTEAGVWRPERQLNVRADYPEQHNGFDAKAPIVCVVPDTGAVVLAAAPIAVAGGAWWVPVADVR